MKTIWKVILGIGGASRILTIFASRKVKVKKILTEELKLTKIN